MGIRFWEGRVSIPMLLCGLLKGFMGKVLTDSKDKGESERRIPEKKHLGWSNERDGGNPCPCILRWTDRRDTALLLRRSSKVAAKGASHCGVLEGGRSPREGFHPNLAKRYCQLWAWYCLFGSRWIGGGMQNHKVETWHSCHAYVALALIIQKIIETVENHKVEWIFWTLMQSIEKTFSYPCSNCYCKMYEKFTHFHIHVPFAHVSYL